MKQQLPNFCSGFGSRPCYAKPVDRGTGLTCCASSACRSRRTDSDRTLHYMVARPSVVRSEPRYRGRRRPASAPLVSRTGPTSEAIWAVFKPIIVAAELVTRRPRCRTWPRSQRGINSTEAGSRSRPAPARDSHDPPGSARPGGGPAAGRLPISIPDGLISKCPLYDAASSMSKLLPERTMATQI